MRILFPAILYFVSCLQIAFGQTFSSTGASQAMGYGTVFAYFNNGINVTGLGSLDGTSLGVTNLEITFSFASQIAAVQADVQVYLVAPNGNLATFILSNKIANGANKTYSFNLGPASKKIHYEPNPAPGTYLPIENFNSLNRNQSANGLWRLYAVQTTQTATVTVNSWNITFGNTNLSPGAPNQSFATSTFIDTTFISGTNKFNGIVVGDSKGSDVGDGGKQLTETSVWYSFVPKCTNDKIEINELSGNGFIYSAILNSSRTVVKTLPKFIWGVGNAVYTNFVAGNTYYLAMDSDEGDPFQYTIKLTEGTAGCSTPPTITTTNQLVTDYCINSSVDINFTNTGTFNAGNRFTAQLSDTLGSFTNAQVLGFKDATTPIVINGTLPAGLKPGKSYKIRVVGSAPATTGSANTGINMMGPPNAPSAITGKTTVCAGEMNVTYSAGTVLNATKYRWKLTGSAQIIATTTDSSSITVNFGNTNSDITVSAINGCGSSAAYQKTITITQPLTPTISIDQIGTTICQGDSVKLQSSFTNQGTSPIFSWKVNNQNYGTNTAAITIKNLKNKDSVSVTLTSNQTCLTTPAVVSSKLIFIVKDTVKPFVNITGNTTQCSGSFTTLTAKTQNKGISPVFNWYVNNTLQTNSSDSTFKTNQFQNKDSVWVKLTSNAACVRPLSFTSVKLKITITNTIIPLVNIADNAPVCKGSPLVLNALGQNEGSNPVYNWYVNNVLQNTSGSNFSSSKLQDKDSIYVTLTSDDACAQPAKVSSPKIKISVTDTIKPSVSVSGNIPVCQGANITLNATTTNKGSTPVFNWFVNNVLQNIPDSIFKSTSLKNKDSVWVTLASNAACVKPATVTSMKSIVAVMDTIIPSVKITGNTLICSGAELTLTANTLNRGKNPVFKWYINNTLQNSADSTLKSSQFKNKDSIWVILVSDLVCARPAGVASPKVVIAATDTVKPSVTISGPAFTCKGQNVILQAQYVNGGNNPSFSWFVNGAEQNTNNVYFSGTNFKNGDSFVVKLTSDLQCSLPKTVLSDALNVLIYDTIKPGITLITDTVFCLGQPVTIFSKVENGGNNPVYSWIDSDVAISQDKDFSSDLPVGNHTLTGVVASSENCAFPASAGKTITITVKDTVKIRPIITGDTVLCKGSGTIFSLKSPANSTNMTYNWLLNGLATGQNSNMFTYIALTDGESIALQSSSSEKCVAFSNSNVLSVEVNTAITPEISVTTSASEACPGEEIVYRAQITNPGMNATYNWTQNNQSVGNNEDSLVTTINPQTNVNLNYSTILTCGTFNASYPAPAVSLKESAPFLLPISGPDTYCADDESIIFSTNKVENAVYEWKYPSYVKSSEKGNNITISMEGNTNTDTLKVRARNACGTGNEVSILLYPKNCTTLFIPNAILTSDETGNNLWKIKGIENYPSVLVMVFNRWGMKVFSSLGYTEAWDGTIRGKELPTGTYYYVIEGIEKKPLTGALTIVH